MGVAGGGAAGCTKLTKHGAFCALMLISLEDRLGWAAVQGKPVGPTGFNLVSTWGQPGVNLGSTLGQPWINLESTWGQCRANLGSTCGQPGVERRGGQAGEARRLLVYGYTVCKQSGCRIRPGPFDVITISSGFQKYI